MSESTSFTFEADVFGTRLEAEIAVYPPSDRNVAAAQADFACALSARLRDVVDGYEPQDDSRDESLDAYMLLAHAWQLIDLAKDSVDAAPKQAMQYFAAAEDDLLQLHDRDPRFTAAYHFARRGRQAAGDFVAPDLLYEVCEALETWMPRRVYAPGHCGRVVLVDDRQSAESFKDSLLPEPDAVSVRMVDADELDAGEYHKVGRTVLPVPMFADGCVEPRLECISRLAPLRVHYAFRADREDFALLRFVGDAAIRFTTDCGGFTPVDFYTALAYAKQLCVLAHSERFDEDGLYRRKVIRELEGALGTLSHFDTDFEVPKRLVALAAGLNEDMGSTEVVEVARSLHAWLPRDLSESIPRGWDWVLDDELDVSLVDGLNEIPGRRFVAVFDEQTNAEFAETELPDRDRLVPVSLGEQLDEDVFDFLPMQLFRSHI